jgi:nucleoside-diphosphate kinase
MVEFTLAIIKPDAVSKHHSGAIIDQIEKNGFDILHLEKGYISAELAEEFYAEHKEKPFFKELVSFISSGPSIIMMLKKESGVKAWRDLMGATDPAQAAPGTLRHQFGTNIGENAVHGSASLDDAMREIMIFFPDLAPESD